ncbi:hypothetical protein [Ruegeria aquimaris]|uniref:Uncharacterized protein n=1 Tax=Ruegeria aquimaris TaxID=2984333 RepID=A0ABT3ARJ6_9RHOB|nr:hypothetical protein [Ruegeria sp. XHP0148]MCV2891312.1 hypothetical protein [Ruegeria sp. XHP0148]
MNDVGKSNYRYEMGAMRTRGHVVISAAEDLFARGAINPRHFWSHAGSGQLTLAFFAPKKGAISRMTSFFKNNDNSDRVWRHCVNEPLFRWLARQNYIADLHPIMYPKIMNKICRIAACLVATFFAVFVLLYPAKLVAGVMCQEPSSMIAVSSTVLDHHAVHAHPAAGSLDHHAAGEPKQHSASHCELHFCAVTIVDLQHGTEILTDFRNSDGQTYARSMTEQASPEGLRRPPRA